MKRLFHLLAAATALLVSTDREGSSLGDPVQTKPGDIEVADQPMGVILRKLQTMGHRVCFEEVKIDTARDRMVDAQGQISWRKKTISLRIDRNADIEETLETLVSSDDSYTWYQYEDSDIYVVHPFTEKNPKSNESELMWEIGPIDIESKSLKAVLEEDFGIADHNIHLSTRGDSEPLERTVAITLEEMPFREALNELLLQEDDLYWSLGGLSGRILHIGKSG